MTLKEFKQKINVIPEEFDNLEMLVWDTDLEGFTKYMVINKLEADGYTEDKIIDDLPDEEYVDNIPGFLFLTFQNFLDDNYYDENGNWIADSELVINIADKTVQ